MATITSTANGNWSDGATWVGGVAPGIGDTAVIAHNVTIDVNTTVGTSPNDATTAVVTINAGKILTVSATLTIKGNVAATNGAGLTLSAGGQIVFDNASSGGSPEYRITGGGIYALIASGTSGSGCGISAIAGQSWTFYNGASGWMAFSSATVTYCTFTRMRRNGTGGFQVFSGTSAFTNCTFDDCGTVQWYGTATTITLTVDNCTWINGAYSANGAVKLELTGARSSGTRRFSGNIINGSLTYVSRGLTITHNVFTSGAGLLPVAGSNYDWTLLRNNFICADGTANGGNGQIILTSADRNYFVISNASGNPHFISATALLTSTDGEIKQCIFESQTPDAVDIGDCVIVNPSAVSGSNKIKVKNCIVAQAKNSESSGCLLTIYGNSTTVTEFERCTANVNNSTLVGSIGRRGAFAFAEAGNGGAGQIAVLKSNLAHGTAASQGFLGERVGGNTKDHITPAGCDKNWRYNTSDGDNGRGYEDRAASNTLWTAGDASAAGADANQGSGNPAFVGVTRKSTDWVAERGYGTTFADVLTALAVSPATRIADLINYVFEGHKPTNAAMRTAAHDGACVGAANFHDSARTLTKSTAAIVATTNKYL